MSANCLVSKLKGTVVMTDPLYYDKIFFSVPQNSSPTENNNWIAIGTNESPVTLKALNGATFGPHYNETNNYTERTMRYAYPNRMNWYPANTAGPVSFELDNKFNLRQFGGANLVMDIKRFTGCNLAWVLFKENPNLTGDISVFEPMSSLTYCGLRNCKYLTGSLKAFSDKVNLTYLGVDTGFNEHGIYGDIALLSNLTELQSLFLYGHNIVGSLSSLGKLTKLTIMSLAETNVEGSLESLVVAQRANGRTSDSTGIKLDWLGTRGKITFNGSAIASTSNKMLTWTSNTITYDGVTINA